MKILFMLGSGRKHGNTDQVTGLIRDHLQAIANRQFEKPTFRSLMTFQIQQRFWRKADPQRVDSRYWKDQGWLEPGQDYYIPHRTGWLKMALAHLSAALIAPFVS
jgi:hypothetical protein